MIVGIHQPNYAPWLGYFRKIALSDHFIFLDDVAFSKGSVTNRVRILENGAEAWLSIPAKPSLGTLIKDIVPSQEDWPQRHLSRLANAYRKAPAFKSVWPDIETLYQEIPSPNLSDANRHLIESVCRKVGIETRFHLSSSIENPNGTKSDDRLIELIAAIPGADTYLSGSGGRKYQDEGKFAAAGLSLLYNDYTPVPYAQPGPDFVPGLSVLDAVFNLGWDGTAELIDGALTPS